MNIDLKRRVAQRVKERVKDAFVDFDGYTVETTDISPTETQLRVWRMSEFNPRESVGPPEYFTVKLVGHV